MVAKAAAPTEQASYLAIAKAISDPTRLQMIQLVASADEYACTALESALAVSKSTISYHVKVLRHAGLLDVRREGKFFHYRLRRDILDYYLPHILDRI